MIEVTPGEASRLSLTVTFEISSFQYQTSDGKS